MDRTIAVLRVAELALAQARKALRIISLKQGPQGPKGDPGSQGEKGEPGPAGLGFDDLDMATEDGGRVLIFRFKRGDEAKEFRLLTAQGVYRGPYVEGRQYLPGDNVTWGGSTWHCNEETRDRPEGINRTAWTLSCKRGRDGKRESVKQ